MRIRLFSLKKPHHRSYNYNRKINYFLLYGTAVKQKNIHSAVLLGLILISGQTEAAASASVPKFDHAVLDQHAALYGNKTANLTELERIVGHLNKQIKGPVSFAVPPFFGIGSQEIIEYLKTIPYEQTTAWEYILDQWEQFKANQSIDAQQLTDGARDALANIRAALQQTNFDIDRIINTQNPTRQTELKTFLDNTTQQDKLLMVRSTGREDGKELSNAGGNASIASVKPERAALSDAIKEVLESYASEKSIGQRLVGKDKHLFDTPFMAVLLQAMIGEIYDVSNEIPRSGVMFSPEAEGETPDVVVVQATFGHNEGVVNGLVPVDTYYVGPSNVIHPVIRIKDKRLAALPGKPGLDFVTNDSVMQRASTLNPETVLALKPAAQIIQTYYGNAVDIEFVILGNIVYLVQVRPLEAKKFDASYLKNRFVAQAQTRIPVTPIGVGNAAVRIITNTDQVIITDNIRQALDTFLFKTKDQNTIQAVIINESAPATSHEATQFRRLGIPVLYTQELGAVKALLQNIGSEASSAASSSDTAEGNSLLIDAQRALIIQFIPTAAFASPQNAIQLGWYAHPIAQQVSLMPEFLTKTDASGLRELTPEEFFKGTKTTQLIDLIKQSKPEEARKALRSLLHRVMSTLQRMQLLQKGLKTAATETNLKVIAQLKQIFAHMLNSAYEINEVLKHADAERLERLYPITFLEALIRQLPEPHLLVNDYSFGSVIKTELQEHKIVKEIGLQGQELRAHIVQYGKAGDSALVPAVQNNWNSFLKGLADIPNQNLQQQFARFMLNLAQLDVMPLWLNTSFATAYTAHPGNAQQIADTLLAEYAGVSDFMHQLQELQQSFISFNVSAFEDPAAFEKQWGILSNNIESLETTAESLETATGLGKIAALQVMSKGIEVFDTSIKALTGSAQYTDVKQKVERFKRMLFKYYFLFMQLADIPSIDAELKTMLDDNTFPTVQQYLDTISKTLSAATTEPEELKPSERFNVAAAALGSKADWRRSRGYRLTLEDLFTLIHQNLLAIQGILAKQADLAEIPVPATVQALNNAAKSLQIIQDIRQGKAEYSKANLIGISFADNTIIYHYNLPIRNHSNTFQITYNLKTHTTTLTAQFLGEAHYRWQMFADMVYIMGRINGMHLEKPIEIDTNRGLLSFTWEITTPQQATVALNFVKILAQRTNNYFGQAFNQKTFLNVVAENSHISIEVLIKEMMRAIATQPTLLIYIPDITEALGIDHPLVAEANTLLLNNFATLPKNLRQSILDRLSNSLDRLSNFPLKQDSIFALLKIIYENPNLLINHQNTARTILRKISDSHKNVAVSFSNDVLLKSPSEDVLIEGINLLASAVFLGTPDASLIQSANNALNTFIDSSSPKIKLALINLATRLLNKNSLTGEPGLIELIKTSTFADNDVHTAIIQTVLPALLKKEKYIDLIKDIALKSLNFGDDDQQTSAVRLLSDIAEKSLLSKEQLELVKASAQKLNGRTYAEQMDEIIQNINKQLMHIS